MLDKNSFMWYCVDNKEKSAPMSIEHRYADGVLDTFNVVVKD